MSGGQGVKRIRDYFPKSEANLNNGEEIKGKPESKLASVEVPKQLDSVWNSEEDVQARSEGSKVDWIDFEDYESLIFKRDNY